MPPWQGIPGVAVEFESESEILQELHHWWVRELLTMLRGREFGCATTDPYDAVSAARPGLRRILDAYAGHPALTECRRRESQLLGSVAA